jgi:hypothetical protein
MLVDIAGSKLTGAMPAIDGSALTGVSGFMKNASDPATDTNPSGGVGSGWVNTSDGEIFICTDATTDANVWYNVGGGDGDIQPWGFPGAVSGFIAGGENGPNSNVIDKFSFSNPTTGTDVGDLAIARRTPAGASSTTHGYTCGGEAPQDTQVNSIEKFAFSGGNSTSITTTLTVARAYFDGQSSSTHGYTSGGWLGPGNSNTIDKFPFSNDNGPSTDVGDLTAARYNQAAITGQSYGYNAGGREPTQNTIDKFSFSSDGNATDHGDLFVARIVCSASSSPTHGYASGGSGPANEIQKFAFSSNTTASDIGNLSTGVTTSCGVTGVNHGYCVGGDTGSYVTTIDKFSFSSDADATDVGDMTSARGNMAGTQI